MGKTTAGKVGRPIRFLPRWFPACSAVAELPFPQSGKIGSKVGGNEFSAGLCFPFLHLSFDHGKPGRHVSSRKPKLRATSKTPRTRKRPSWPAFIRITACRLSVGFGPAWCCYNQNEALPSLRV